MITFEKGIDIRCRQQPSPCIAKLNIGSGDYRYIIIGTDYGYIHTSGGNVRTWKTYSGAYKFIRKYQQIKP